jgi:hypothetical protein
MLPLAMTDVDVGTGHARPARSSDTKAAAEYLRASGATAITVTTMASVRSTSGTSAVKAMTLRSPFFLIRESFYPVKGLAPGHHHRHQRTVTIKLE